MNKIDIEKNTATMSSAETFGHFLLPLTMNKGHIEAKLADQVFIVRSHYLGLKTTRPERHALGNLLGMLAFRIGKFEEALGYLDRILSFGEDSENLNALANRKYMCEKLFRFPEARECERRILELITEDGTEVSKNRCRRLRARSLAEQAFAYSFEIFGESVTVERYRKSVELYDQATQLAGHLIGQEEREDWAIVYGMACHKIYKKVKRDWSLRDQSKTWYQKAVNKFLLIIQESKDFSLVSDSWRHLGELFKNPRHVPSLPEGMRRYLERPGKCFEEALKISPHNSRILARYAGHFQFKRNYSMAMLKVNESIMQDTSVFNNHAYYVRASLWLDIYKKLLKDMKRPPYEIPDCTFLEYAENDLKIAQQQSYTPWHFHCMAEVLYHKAKDPNGQVKQGDEGQANLQLALTYCAKAVTCQDGQKVAEYHKLRGDCLCDMGEHQAALGCYKRALECEIGADYFEGSRNSLVIEFEHILMKNTPLSEDPHFLEDMVYWLLRVANICLYIGKTLWPLLNLKQLVAPWKKFVKYCEDNRHKSKLQTIELATVDVTKRPKQSVTRRHQGYPETHSFDMVASVFVVQTAGVQNESDQGKVVETFSSTEEAGEGAGVPRGASAAPAGPIPDKVDKDVLTVSQHLSQVDLDGNEEHPIAPDTIHVTYSVNLKTGKTQHVATRPSPEEPPTEVVSKKHVRVAPERPLNHWARKYDFFVIYSSSASEWVQHRMLEELEGTGFKGCIKDRDFELGKPRNDNYTDSIEDSVCIIIVLTRDFETNKYDVSGMHWALDSDRLVIPVLRENRAMPTVLKTLEHLDATGAVDWPRLERCIEQQVKLEAVQNACERLVVPVLREDRAIPPLLKTLEYLDATGVVDWPRLERCIKQKVKLEAVQNAW
ncbi:uncharacterized protein LOC119720300 [Patiria miniata]|uniref:TIR domain-containing protein n=1 Tax=Patiria miniata TaxID=46514 RepID=A0A913Z543_PATMI|nr:uncharacterized protein LOC119720300 [Patiria miniata]